MSHVDETKQAQQEFQDLRFGMFIHFGIYSLGEKEEWHMFRQRMSHADYKQEFMVRFNPDPLGIEQWVTTAKEMGAKYIVVTSKHHDGFCLWDTKILHGLYPEYHIRSTEFWKKNKKSVIDYLFEAGRKHGIKIGLYYSTIDWSWTGIEKRRWLPQFHVLLKKKNQDLHAQYVEYYKEQVLELTQLYPDNLCFWFDGYQFRHPRYPNGFLEYLNYADIYQRIKDINPRILVGNNTGSTRADKELGLNDLLLLENMAGLGEQRGAMWPRKTPMPGEVCLTLNNHWGYSKKDKKYKSPESLQKLVIINAIRNANTLLNFGPTPHGYIAEDQIPYAQKIGELIQPYSEMIYHTRNVKVTNWGGIAHNTKSGQKYAYFSKSIKKAEISKRHSFSSPIWLIGGGEIRRDSEGNLFLSEVFENSLLKL